MKIKPISITAVLAAVMIAGAAMTGCGGSAGDTAATTAATASATTQSGTAAQGSAASDAQTAEKHGNVNKEEAKEIALDNCTDGEVVTICDPAVYNNKDCWHVVVKNNAGGYYDCYVSSIFCEVSLSESGGDSSAASSGSESSGQSAAESSQSSESSQGSQGAESSQSAQSSASSDADSSGVDPIITTPIG